MGILDRILGKEETETKKESKKEWNKRGSENGYIG